MNAMEKEWTLWMMFTTILMIKTQKEKEEF